MLHCNTLSWFITSATTDHIPEVHSPSAESMDLLFGKLTKINYSQQKSPKCSICVQSQNTTQQNYVFIQHHIPSAQATACHTMRAKQIPPEQMCN